MKTLTKHEILDELKNLGITAYSELISLYEEYRAYLSGKVEGD